MARRLDDEVDWENELLDLTKETTHDEKVELLGKLLDSDSTLFSKKMRDWLVKDDALNVLIHYVTRPVSAKKEEGGETPQPAQEGEAAPAADPTTPVVATNAALEFTILNSEEYIISSNKRRDALLASEAEKKELREQQKLNGEEDSLEDEEDEDDFAFSNEAKRADKAAEVFVYQAGSLPQEFIDKNLEDIVKEIFAIFEINAEGDFDNFDKMFAALLGPYGSKVFNVFTKNRKLILHLLNYLHDPAISETLMGVIKATLPDQVLVTFYTTLNEDGFWTSLGQKIYGPGSESSFEDASAFFNRLVDLCATQTNADVLFAHLSQDMSFIDGLVDCIANNTNGVPPEQQIAAINALRAILLKSGEQLYDTSLEAYTPTPVANMLSGIHEDLHNHLKSRASALAQRLIDDAKQPRKKTEEATFSTFKVPTRFTVHRLHLLEVLAELTQQNPQEVLDSFSAPLWKALSDWLLEHRFNNIYHDLFYKLFRTAIRINHVESMKALLSKHKFLTRVIEHYKATNSKDSGLRSYIILMCNYVRLTADAQPPSEYLKSFLASHSQWKEFVPLLKEDTIKQFVTAHPAPLGGHPISLSPFASAESFGLYSSMAPPKPITDEDVDVDLGSEYANSLGLEDASVYVEMKKKRRRKRKSRSKKAAGEGEKEGEENAEGEGGEDEEEGEDSEGSDDEGEDGEEADDDSGPVLEEVPVLEEECPLLQEETPANSLPEDEPSNATTEHQPESDSPAAAAPTEQNNTTTATEEDTTEAAAKKQDAETVPVTAENVSA